MADSTAPAAADTGAAATTTPATGTTNAPDTGNPTPPAQTQPAQPPAQPAQPEPAATVDPTLQAEMDRLRGEVDKWKNQARKHEGRATANATAQAELERLRLESMTEQERVVEQTRVEARAEVMREFGVRLVQTEFRAAAAGRIEDDRLATVLEAVDLSKFITADGEPDTDKVKAFVDGMAPKQAEPSKDDPKGDENNGQQPPAATAPAQPAGLPPLHGQDIGQGAGRAEPIPLNGDPILDAVKALVGNRRR